eukprot:3269836-Amphidinium_carterae.1
MRVAVIACKCSGELQCRQSVSGERVLQNVLSEAEQARESTRTQKRHQRDAKHGATTCMET